MLFCVPMKCLKSWSVQGGVDIMVSVQDLTADDVVNADPVTVNVGQTLSKLRAKMEDERLRTVPVVDGAKFVGMLSYRDVMEKLRSDPSHTKVDKLLHEPPRVEQDQTLVDLSNLRIDSGRKKFALIGEHDRLDGVIGERELVYPARDTEELQGVSVDAVMEDDVITVTEDERVETARSRMMDNNISRLPVVDDAGELTGLLTSTDVMRAMVPREQMTEGDVKGFKESFSDVPVHELMEQEEVIAPEVLEDGDASLREAIDIMRENGTRELLLVKDDAPVGIVTLKDVVDHIAGQEIVDSLLVQLTGPEVPEEKQAIHEKVETAVRGGLGRLMHRPEELAIHMKKYETDGKRHKYALNFKLSSKEGVTTVKAHGWDLLNAVDEGLEKLETVLKREKEKRIDQKRERQRRGKRQSE